MVLYSQDDEHQIQREGCNTTSAGSIKVIDTGGGGEVLHEYTRSINAAELMLENPRKFVCDSTQLVVNSRTLGLAADEELDRCRLYFLLPMDMLYYVLTQEEMDTLSRRAARAMKKGSSKNIRKIFPVLSDFCLFPTEVKEVVEPVRMIGVVGKVSGVGMLRQRSWMPALDTIEETACM